MRIISGLAGGINLSVPKGLAVRPTSGRARKGLFDSIRDFSGKTVIDLFAGAGSLGLEAASRGAAKVILVENNSRHIAIIRGNIEKVLKTGIDCDIKLIRADVLSFGAWGRGVEAPDYVFADPPYPESGEYFKKLTGSEEIRQLLANGRLIWELPDRDDEGDFLMAEGWKLTRRRFGRGDFIVAELEK
jgi:16S rRNA (guanine966-N2)-methyltransferase